MSNTCNPICLDATGSLLSSADLLPVVRELSGNKLLIAVSGRDSLAAWLLLRDAGFDLVPYWCYTVPGLSYDEEMIAYYERFFDAHIIRLPHPRTYILLRSAAYLPPVAWCHVRAARLPEYTYADIEDTLAQQNGLNMSTYLCAVGIRAADNLMRHRLIHQLGTIGLKRRHYYYAVWDYKTADVRDVLVRAGCKLSKSYLFFGSTGDGIDYSFLRYLRDNLPEDYRRVLDVYPLADAELYRYERVR